MCAVNWDDAKAFCAWLTEREQKASWLSARQSYRLPLDLEWSRAVGLEEETGNTPKQRDRKIKGVYPWGTQWPPPPGAGNFAGREARDATYPNKWATIDGYEDSYPRTAPVGSFKANQYGLFDLSGNVWEWCEDSYDESADARFLRGGSWAYDMPDSLLSSYRYYYRNWRVRGIGGGFRVVLAINGTDAHAEPVAVEATKAEPKTNSLGMVFVPVPGITALFCVWDTRARDFEAFVAATDYPVGDRMFGHRKDGWRERANEGWCKPGFAQTPDHPLVGVNWNEAEAFCDWLTKKEQQEGTLDQAHEYRLPSDAEWSRAAGETRYPWGNDWPPPAGAGNYGSEETQDGNMPRGKWTIAGYRDGYARTSPVGSFKPNAYGLYDMGGNVWQWCRDWYRTEMNEASVLSAFPALSADGGGHAYRIYRGGAWNDSHPKVLLSANRMGDGFAFPDKRYDNTGFRCVLAGKSPE